MSLAISMAIFSLSMSISPGPVNLVALTSGLHHGALRSMRFVLGATFGFILLLSLIGLGLGSFLNSFPAFLVILKYGGCVYIFYIGYLVFSDTTKGQQNEQMDNVPTFIQGCFMQWLNPKAWVACIAGCAAFNVYASIQVLVKFNLIYFFVCFIGISTWSIMGEKINKWISSDRHIRSFNRLMGAILCTLAVVLLLSE